MNKREGGGMFDGMIAWVIIIAVIALLLWARSCQNAGGAVR